VWPGGGEPGGLLPALAGLGAAPRGDRAARCDPALGALPSPLRLSPDHGPAAARGLVRQPQAGQPIDARGQPAVPAAPGFRAGDDRQRAPLSGLSQPRPQARDDGGQPALGGGHHLCPAAGGLRLSGGRARRPQPARGRLGHGDPPAGKPRPPGLGQGALARSPPAVWSITPTGACSMPAATTSPASKPTASCPP
jgi:hypothetical protein